MRRFSGLLSAMVLSAAVAQAAVLTPVSQTRRVLLHGPGVGDGDFVMQAAPDFSEFDAALAGPAAGPPTSAVVLAEQHSVIHPYAIAGLGSASAAWIELSPYYVQSSFEVRFALTEATPIRLSGALECGLRGSTDTWLGGPSGTTLYIRGLRDQASILPVFYEAILPAGEYRLWALATAYPVDTMFGSSYARWTFSLAVVPEPTTLALGALGLLLVQRRVGK